MIKKGSPFSVIINFDFLTNDQFQLISARFEKWRLFQNHLTWSSSGWIQFSQTKGRIFINSKTQINQDEIDFLCLSISQFCKNTNVETKITSN